MAQNDGLNRRSFLRNAGLTALVGAVAPGSSLAAAAGAAAGARRRSDASSTSTRPYSRIGTDSTKWDGPINTGLTDKDHIVAGMGIADMDFRVRAGDHPGAPGTDEARRLGLHDHAEVVPRGHRRLEQEALRHRRRPGAARHHHRRASRAWSPRCARSRLPAAKCC